MQRHERPLRVTTYLSPAAQQLYEAVGAVLADSLARRMEFTVADSYERLVDGCDDVAFVCSVPYVLLADAGSSQMVPVATPILAGDRYRGRPVYFSDVVVHRGSRYRSFADLRGATLAYNEAFSQSGFMVVAAKLESLGETARFFGGLYAAGFHHEALRLVAEGSVDAAAIDSHVLEIKMRMDPELESHIRIVETLGPSAIQPVLASTGRLSAEERRVVRRELLRAGQDVRVRTRLADARVDRFVGIDDGHYDDIRAAIRRVERAGLVSPNWRRSWPRQPVMANGVSRSRRTGAVPEGAALDGMLGGWTRSTQRTALP